MEEGLHRQQQVLLNLSELDVEGLSVCLLLMWLTRKPKQIQGVTWMSWVSTQSQPSRSPGEITTTTNISLTCTRHECETCSVFDWTDGGTNIDIFRSHLRCLCAYISLKFLPSNTATNIEKTPKLKPLSQILTPEFVTTLRGYSYSSRSCDLEAAGRQNLLETSGHWFYAKDAPIL